MLMTNLEGETQCCFSTVVKMHMDEAVLFYKYWDYGLFVTQQNMFC